MSIWACVCACGSKLDVRKAYLTSGDTASRVSFVLTDGLQLKKLAFLDGVFDGQAQEKEDGFDADAAIATGELRKMVPELLAALGGEMALGAAGTAL